MKLKFRIGLIVAGIGLALLGQVSTAKAEIKASIQRLPTKVIISVDGTQSGRSYSLEKSLNAKTWEGDKSAQVAIIGGKITFIVDLPIHAPNAPSSATFYRIVQR